jgi:hypothetical protein
MHSVEPREPAELTFAVGYVEKQIPRGNDNKKGKGNSNSEREVREGRTQRSGSGACYFAGSRPRVWSLAWVAGLVSQRRKA